MQEQLYTKQGKPRNGFTQLPCFQCLLQVQSQAKSPSLGPTPKSFNNSKSLAGHMASPTLDFLCGLPFLAFGFLCEWPRNLPFNETRCRKRCVRKKIQYTLHDDGRLTIQTREKHITQLCSLLGLKVRNQNKKNPAHADIEKK